MTDSESLMGSVKGLVKAMKEYYIDQPIRHRREDRDLEKFWKALENPCQDCSHTVYFHVIMSEGPLREVAGHQDCRICGCTAYRKVL